MMMTDGGGLDTQQCSFYHKNVTVSNIEYAPGIYTNTTVVNGSHGTMSAGVAVGQFCGGQMGVANESALLFFDIQDNEGTLQLPLDWTVLYDAAAARNVSLHSISWGINFTAGIYDETASDLDWLTVAYDILPCASAGNTGLPRICLNSQRQARWEWSTAPAPARTACAPARPPATPATSRASRRRACWTPGRTCRSWPRSAST